MHLPSLYIQRLVVMSIGVKDTERRSGLAASRRLHAETTASARMKHRVSEEMDEIWADIEAWEDSDLGLGGGAGEGDEEGGEESAARQIAAAVAASDPTYELACLKRANEKTDSLGVFVKNSRKMFLLQVRPTLRASKFESAYSWNCWSMHVRHAVKFPITTMHHISFTIIWQFWCIFNMSFSVFHSKFQIVLLLLLAWSVVHWFLLSACIFFPPAAAGHVRHSSHIGPN